MDPKAGFIISRVGRMSDQQRKSLDLLYQPILMPNAYALINLLWRLGEIKRDNLIQEPVTNLLTFLPIGGRAFDQAKNRLEGASLLKTLVHRDNEQVLYVYQLIPPVEAADFYQDDLLSVDLLETVGIKQYRRLNHTLVPKPHHFGKGFHDVTKNFLDVFTVNHNELTKPPKIVSKLRSQEPRRSLLQDVNDGHFKFKMLLQILQQSFVDLNEVKRHQKLILTEHTLFGLDELQMANFIKRAASVSSNRVNFNRLKVLISKAYQGRRRPQTQPSQATFASSSAHRPNSQLVSEEKSLVKAAESYAPVEFLDHLRQKIHSNEVVTHKEIWIIKNLMGYHAFRDNQGVINIMIYYAVVDRQMTSLKSGFMDTMVNSWTAANVNTPREALLEIGKFKHSKQKQWQQYTRKRYHRYNHYRHRPIKEGLPKWARQKTDPKKLHRTSRALQHKIRERLKRLGED